MIHSKCFWNGVEYRNNGSDDFDDDGGGNSNNNVVSQRGSMGNAITWIRRDVLKNVFSIRGKKRDKEK